MLGSVCGECQAARTHASIGIHFLAVLLYDKRIFAYSVHQYKRSVASYTELGVYVRDFMETRTKQYDKAKAEHTALTVTE